jgi:hypothetical protein
MYENSKMSEMFRRNQQDSTGSGVKGFIDINNKEGTQLDATITVY